MDTDNHRASPDYYVELPDLRVAKASGLTRANTLANRIAEYFELEISNSTRKVIHETKKLMAPFELYMARREFDRPTLARYPKWLISKGRRNTRLIMAAAKFVRWLWKMRYIKEPMDDVFPKVDMTPKKSLASFITEEDYKRFITESHDSLIAWAAVCSYHTGLRLKDVCALQWSSVDFDQQIISLKPAKTMRYGQTAGIPILTDSDLHIWLKRLWDERVDDGLVCPPLWYVYAMGDNPGNGLSNKISRAMRRMGIKATFHAFRSTFESRMANSGIPIAVAAKVTGRTDPRSLMRYILPDMEMVRAGLTHAFSNSKITIINERRHDPSADKPVARPAELSTGRAFVHTGEVEGVPCGVEESFELSDNWKTGA